MWFPIQIKFCLRNMLSSSQLGWRVLTSNLRLDWPKKKVLRFSRVLKPSSSFLVSKERVECLKSSFQLFRVMAGSVRGRDDGGVVGEEGVLASVLCLINTI